MREASSEMTRVLYFGVTDLAYPRNRRIRDYLTQELGYSVVAETIDARRGYYRNSLHLLRSALRRPAGIDAVFLAEFSLQYCWIAWFIAKRNRSILVVDWFVGLYETRVLDYAPETAGSLKARMFRLVDIMSLKLANIVITDTEFRAQMLVDEYGAGRLPLAVPVGAPDWARPDDSRKVGRMANSPLRLLYYGNYIPLHGVPKLLRALATLPADLDIQLTLVGDGKDRATAEALVRRLSLGERCTFRGSVPEEQLIGLIRDHDVVLGVFGDSSKARNVIANKVWQGLASGAVVVTQASPALLEIEGLVPNLLRQVTGDERSIADELSLIYAAQIDASEHAAITVDRALDNYTNAKLKMFSEQLDATLERRRPSAK